MKSLKKFFNRLHLAFSPKAIYFNDVASFSLSFLRKSFVVTVDREVIHHSCQTPIA